MPEDNVEQFRQMTEAVNRGDTEWLAERTTDDIEFLPRRAGTEGAFHGREGIRRFMEDTAESFEVFQIAVSEMRGIDDRVLAIGTIRVKGKGSGIETDIPMAVVATYRDGKVAHFMDHGDRDEAVVAFESG